MEFHAMQKPIPPRRIGQYDPKKSYQAARTNATIQSLISPVLKAGAQVKRTAFSKALRAPARSG
jgi:hypothetical protein